MIRKHVGEFVLKFSSSFCSWFFFLSLLSFVRWKKIALCIQLTIDFSSHRERERASAVFISLFVFSLIICLFFWTDSLGYLLSMCDDVLSTQDVNFSLTALTSILSRSRISVGKLCRSFSSWSAACEIRLVTSRYTLQSFCCRSRISIKSTSEILSLSSRCQCRERLVEVCRYLHTHTHYLISFEHLKTSDAHWIQSVSLE